MGRWWFMGGLYALLKGNDQQLYEDFSQLGDYILGAAETFLALAQDLRDSQIHAATLHQIEHDCDKLAEKIHRFLDNNTFLPFEHEDIEELLSSADSVVDLLWGAANRIANIYELDNPDPELEEIAEIIVGMAEETRNLFTNLKNIKGEASLVVIIKRLLGGKNPEINLAEIVTRLHGEENRTDELRDLIAKRRFRAAKKDPAQEPIRDAWSEVIQHLEHATDRCVDVTDVLKKFSRKYK